MHAETEADLLWTSGTLMRTNECWSFMPGSGFLLASAARPTGVASRKDLLPTVMPSLCGKVSDGNLLSTHREDEGAAGDLCVVERDVGDFRAVKRCCRPPSRKRTCCRGP